MNKKNQFFVYLNFETEQLLSMDKEGRIYFIMLDKYFVMKFQALPISYQKGADTLQFSTQKIITSMIELHKIGLKPATSYSQTNTANICSIYTRIRNLWKKFRKLYPSKQFVGVLGKTRFNEASLSVNDNSLFFTITMCKVNKSASPHFLPILVCLDRSPISYPVNKKLFLGTTKVCIFHFGNKYEHYRHRMNCYNIIPYLKIELWFGLDVYINIYMFF